LFKVKIKGKNFALNLTEEECMTFKSKESVTKVWHKRLGHPNETKSKKKKNNKHHDSRENAQETDSDRNNNNVKVVVGLEDLVACYVNSIEEFRNNTS